MKNFNALVAIVMAVASTFAVAHGDEEHAKPRVYDAKKVEPTAFGQEGNPKKVTRTIKVDMTDNMRFTPSDITVSAEKRSSSSCATAARSCMKWFLAPRRQSRNTLS